MTGSYIQQHGRSGHGEDEEERKLKEDKGGEGTDVTTTDLNRVTLWLILYNSATFYMRPVSTV